MPDLPIHRPRVIPYLFRGGKVTSGLSSLRLAEGSSNGGDEVGTDMGKGGGIPEDGGGDGDNTGTGDDTGSGGDTSSDGDGIEGIGEEGIWGSGEDHGESGDDGKVDIARSLATSASDHTGVGTGVGIEILAVT
ncbi:hypothetical protein Tco_0037413 [Tanacetum coccineum]